MLAARRTLTHKYAGNIDLPLLVPAFSSKGFKFEYSSKANKEKEYSEISFHLQHFLRPGMESVLVSAYDIHFNHLLNPNENIKDIALLLKNAQYVFLDSGGYELGTDFDSAEVKSYQYHPKSDYGLKDYELIIQKLTNSKKNLDLIISNYDFDPEGKSLSAQIDLARELFSTCPNSIKSFIIKPTKKSQKKKDKYIDPEGFAINDFKKLSSFDIIGVTEKELGENIFDRMKNIAKIRRKLIEVDLDYPIHVWGGLDPVISALYFFAGADIFDGISWLRYAYRKGIAINKNCNSILDPDYSVATKDSINEGMTGSKNLEHLTNLKYALQEWVGYDGKKFHMFESEIKDHLQRAYSKFKTGMKIR